MYQVSREIDFCYGHRLLHYEGKCRYLHGHNGKVLITFESAALDDRGMVLDFSEIKETISRWIDERLDHRMILHREDPVAGLLQSAGEPLCLLDTNPTAESIARMIYEYALDRGFPVSEVRLWETPKCFAAYSLESPSPERIDVRDVPAACGCGRAGRSA